jgi:hypothetical protein
MIELSEYLKSAKDYFEEYGGARGEAVDSQSKVCAIGALIMINRQMKFDFLYGKSVTVLNNAAIELYGKLIVQVNDHLGIEAVKHCYDYAIKSINTDE